MASVKAFLICPVRNDPNAGRQYTEELESRGWTVHWPARDTNQDDHIGLRICQDNRTAIRDADVVFVVWDGESQGSLFDLGIAFALDKEVRVLSLPSTEPGTKSFQAMIREWAR